MIATELIVEHCVQCPFYERTVASVVADLFVKTNARTGTCRFGGVGRSFPAGRFHIPDEEIIPDRCPLRDGMVSIKLRKS